MTDFVTCGVCGRLHPREAIELTFRLPDVVYELSDEERTKRCNMSTDLCVLDRSRFFVRGLCRYRYTGRHRRIESVCGQRWTNRRSLTFITFGTRQIRPSARRCRLPSLMTCLRFPRAEAWPPPFGSPDLRPDRSFSWRTRIILWRGSRVPASTRTGLWNIHSRLNAQMPAN
jgi:Uncharacterized protein conserved in bacteria (DUF2199)